MGTTSETQSSGNGVRGGRIDKHGSKGPRVCFTTAVVLLVGTDEVVCQGKAGGPVDSWPREAELACNMSTEGAPTANRHFDGTGLLVWPGSRLLASFFADPSGARRYFPHVTTAGHNTGHNNGGGCSNRCPMCGGGGGGGCDGDGGGGGDGTTSHGGQDEEGPITSQGHRRRHDSIHQHDDIDRRIGCTCDAAGKLSTDSGQAALRPTAEEGIASSSTRNGAHRRVPILELGAGTGVSGMAASMALGCPAILTDRRADVIENLRHNVNANGLGKRVRVVPLAWGGGEREEVVPSEIREQSPYQVIIASDTLYPGKPLSDTEAFFATVSKLLDTEQGVLLLAYTPRPPSLETENVLRCAYRAGFDGKMLKGAWDGACSTTESTKTTADGTAATTHSGFRDQTQSANRSRGDERHGRPGGDTALVRFGDAADDKERTQPKGRGQGGGCHSAPGVGHELENSAGAKARDARSADGRHGENLTRPTSSTSSTSGNSDSELGASIVRRRPLLLAFWLLSPRRELALPGTTTPNDADYRCGDGRPPRCSSESAWLSQWKDVIFPGVCHQRQMINSSARRAAAATAAALLRGGESNAEDDDAVTAKYLWGDGVD